MATCSLPTFNTSISRKEGGIDDTRESRLVSSPSFSVFGSTHCTRISYTKHQIKEVFGAKRSRGLEKTMVHGSGVKRLERVEVIWVHQFTDCYSTPI